MEYFPDGTAVLTEDYLLQRHRQYDVAMMYEISVPNLRISSLGGALARCTFVGVMNLSRNQLTSLAGLEHVAATLTHLNVAENKINDISAIATCRKLSHVFLEGNELANMDAVRPLAALPELRELCLMRRIALDGDDDALIMDNPVCRSTTEYAVVRAELFRHVAWLDNVFFRDEKKSATANADGSSSNLMDSTANVMKRMEDQAEGCTTSSRALEDAFAATMAAVATSVEAAMKKTPS